MLPFFHALPIGMLLTLLPCESTANLCAKDTNGCSVPFGINFFFKTLFTPSCNRHDVCYSCGVKYGLDQKACDEAFLENMKVACENARRRRSILDDLEELTLGIRCKGIAHVYYGVVVAVGFLHYRSSVRSYCHEAYVPRCLSLATPYTRSLQTTSQKTSESSATEPASQHVSQQTSHLSNPPATEAASNPASQSTDQPASQRSSQPTSYPTSQASTELNNTPAIQPASPPTTS